MKVGATLFVDDVTTSDNDVVPTSDTDEDKTLKRLCFEVGYRRRNKVNNRVCMKLTSFVNVLPTSENEVISTSCFEITSKTRWI